MLLGFYTLIYGSLKNNLRIARFSRGENFRKVRILNIQPEKFEQCKAEDVGYEGSDTLWCFATSAPP